MTVHPGWRLPQEYKAGAATPEPAPALATTPAATPAGTPAATPARRQRDGSADPGDVPTQVGVHSTTTLLNMFHP